MTKRRIFIAINLPEKLKKRLKEYREQVEPALLRQGYGGQVRWTKIPSLHLTLVFIGYVDDEQLLEACKITRQVAEETEPFFINFKRIITGPKGKESFFAKASEDKPRMIWLEGEVNEDLAQLKSRLEKALLAGNAGLQKAATRAFSPHLTLARVKAGEQEARLNAADVEANFSAQLDVNSIEVMESDLKFDGAEYATLEECPLGVE